MKICFGIFVGVSLLNFGAKISSQQHSGWRRRDSRADYCPSGWIYDKLRCWRYHEEPLRWELARETCKRYDSRSDLASIASEEENGFISAFVQQKGRIRAKRAQPFRPNALSCFERHQQKFLDGWAEGAIGQKTVQQCLKECLESPQKYQFYCHSALYYRDSQTCILNRESHRTKPLSFRNAFDEVDYYENKCGRRRKQQIKRTEILPNQSKFVFQKVRNIKYVGSHRWALMDIPLTECMEACKNASSLYKFNCLSLMYYPAGKGCILNNESRLTAPPRFYQDIDGENVEYYELVYNNTGGAGPSNAKICFKLIRGAVLNGFADAALKMPTADSCKSACLHSTRTFNFWCRSLMYYPETRDCILTNENRLSQPKFFTFVNETGGIPKSFYYDNECLLEWTQAQIASGQTPQSISTGQAFQLQPNQALPRVQAVSAAPLVHPRPKQPDKLRQPVLPLPPLQENIAQKNAPLMSPTRARVISSSIDFPSDEKNEFEILDSEETLDNYDYGSAPSASATVVLTGAHPNAADDLVWMGFLRGQTRWVNDSPMFFEKWAENQPSWNLDELCMGYSVKSTTWSMGLCEDRKPFVCKMLPTKRGKI